MRRAALLLALLVVAGCGGEEEAPEAFAVRVLGLLEDAKAASAWDELHPAQRAKVPRALYVRCEGNSGLGGFVQELTVRGIRAERAQVPGKGREDSIEVRLFFTLTGSPVELDMHVFDVEGEWTWVIGANDYAAYARGDCP